MNIGQRCTKLTLDDARYCDKMVSSVISTNLMKGLATSGFVRDGFTHALDRVNQAHKEAWDSLLADDTRNQNWLDSMVEFGQLDRMKLIGYFKVVMSEIQHQMTVLAQ